MTPRLAVPRAIRSLLDALCVASMFIYLVGTFVHRYDIYSAQQLLVGILLRVIWALIMVGLWLLIRRSGRRPWIVTFVVLAILGIGMDELSMLVLAIVVVYVYLGPRAGHLVVGLSVLVEAALVFLPDNWTLREEVGIVSRTLVTVGVPALIGFTLRRYAEATGRMATLNSELGHASSALSEQVKLDQQIVLAEERARAARELHDGLGHQLTVAGMSLDFASRTLATQPELALQEAGEARSTVSEALGDIRTWAQATRPVGAQTLGLAGLPVLVEGFRSSGLKVHLDLPPDLPELGRRQQLFVTRFAQEGLTNALKHARASEVWLSVDQADGALTLRMANNGALPSSVDDGFGLRSLRERAAEVAGDFEAAVTNGLFVITAHVPLAAVPAGVGHG